MGRHFLYIYDNYKFNTINSLSEIIAPSLIDMVADVNAFMCVIYKCGIPACSKLT